jgi:membrane protein
MSQKRKPFLQRIKDRVFNLSLVQFLVRVFNQMNKNNGLSLAAAIAYYGFLSIFPLLLGLIGLLGYFINSQEIEQQILSNVQQNLPGISDVLVSNIRGVINARGALSIIGILGFLWSGSGIFGAIYNAINRARGITRLPPFYITIPLNVGLTVGMGILFLISMGASYVFNVVPLKDIPIVGAYAIEAGTRVIAFAFSFAIFLILFKIMPNTRIWWRYAWQGAFITAVLFEIGRSVLVFFINNFTHYTSVYGAIGSIIAILVFIYYSAIILIIGVEITAEYSRMRRGETPTNYILYNTGIPESQS